MNNLTKERAKQILLIVQKQSQYGIDKERLLKECTQDEFYELVDKQLISSNPMHYPDSPTTSKVYITPLGNHFIKEN